MRFWNKKAFASALSVLTAINCLVYGSTHFELQDDSYVSAAEEITSKTVVSRESWDGTYSTIADNREIKHKTLCTAVVYDDNSIEITCQNYENVWSSKEIDLGTISYNDSLYKDPVYISKSKLEYNDPSSLNSYITAIESYSGNDKNITFIYAHGQAVITGKTILLELRPIKPFDSKTQISAFGHAVTINAAAIPEQPKDPMFGDVNGDGIINAKDAALILQYAAYLGTSTEPISFLEWRDKN